MWGSLHCQPLHTLFLSNSIQSNLMEATCRCYDMSVCNTAARQPNIFVNGLHLTSPCATVFSYEISSVVVLLLPVYICEEMCVCV